MYLIFSAMAQDASASFVPAGFDFKGVIPLVLFGFVVYFLMIRPQQKKMKAHQALIQGVRRGDRVITAGGLVGVIHKVVNDDEVSLELDEGIRVRLIKTAISQVLAKTEPLDITKDDKQESDVSTVVSPKKDKK